MKTKKIFCVFNEDDSGFPTGDAIAAFPIESAAKEFVKNSKDMYSQVLAFDSVEVDGSFYLLKSSNEVYLYIDCFDKNVPNLAVGENGDSYRPLDRVGTFFSDFRSHTLSKDWIIIVGKSVYVLYQPKPVKLTPFLQSRQLAIDHAMSKLTKEEQSLLGLIV